MDELIGVAGISSALRGSASASATVASYRTARRHAGRVKYIIAI